MDGDIPGTRQEAIWIWIENTGKWDGWLEMQELNNLQAKIEEELDEVILSIYDYIRGMYNKVR